MYCIASIVWIGFYCRSSIVTWTWIYYHHVHFLPFHELLHQLQIINYAQSRLSEIYNGNWTEWSAIWSEIKRAITKLHDRVAGVRFVIASLISDQNCTTRSSITTLLHPFWNHIIKTPEKKLFNMKLSIYLFVKQRNRKRYHISFCMQKN